MKPSSDPAVESPMQKQVERLLPVIDVLITLLLIVVFGLFFFYNHAWGAWGDDSPGYIYTAGQLYYGEELVVQDELVQRGLAAFEDEKLARWLAPTHHEIISPSGWLASKYPIGLSWLMATTGKIAGTDIALYLVVPGLAVATVVMTYWLAIVWIPEYPTSKRVIGILAALAIGLADLFANYAVAQPMRDIPALAFMSGAILALGVTLNRTEGKHVVWLRAAGLALTGVLLGMAMNIRETSVLMIVPILAVVVWDFWKDKKMAIRCVAAVLLGVTLAFSLSIWNSVQITEHKEKFRAKDVTSIAITSNIDHIQSLSFENTYNNQGKFKPGVGGVNQYWGVLQGYSNWPPFIAMAIIGLVVLLWNHKREGAVMAFWIGSMFLLFSMWINPYPRYILSLFVPVALLFAYGTMIALRWIWHIFRLRPAGWLILTVLVVGSFLYTLTDSIQERQALMANQELLFKSISQSDLETVKQVGDTINETGSEKTPLLVLFGPWKAGMSEMVMTHTDVRAVRFPARTNLQPEPDALLQFVEELTTDYDVYLWYDNSVTGVEQRLYTRLSKESIGTFSFSFEEAIELSLVSTPNQ